MSTWNLTEMNQKLELQNEYTLVEKTQDMESVDKKIKITTNSTIYC